MGNQVKNSANRIGGSFGDFILTVLKIFAKILGAGINPKPFLYPAYIKGKKDYVANLEKLLKRMNKKI